MTVIYLVRHGQSQANSKGIWQGAQIDTPLTELGRTQAQNTKRHLEEEGAVFSAVYSSPLLRAGETAGIIAPNQNITFDSRLKEFDYGIWDGMYWQDILERYSEFFDASENLLPNSWEVTGGETYDEVKERLQQFFDELTDKHPDESVLVVSHGFTIKLILDLFLNIGNLVNLNEPTNAGITKFILKNGARTLVYFNR